MGLVILLAGHKRLAGKHARAMMHDISSGIWGKA